MSSARRLASATVALAFSLSSAPELARAAATPAPAADTAEIPIPIPPARTVVTHHTATIGGKLVKYTATAGTILLDDEKRKPTASVFYVAYTVDGATSARRPITFSYNGGPGGSSALVDVGAFGPRMVVTPMARRLRRRPTTSSIIATRFSTRPISSSSMPSGPGSAGSSARESRKTITVSNRMATRSRSSSGATSRRTIAGTHRSIWPARATVRRARRCFRRCSATTGSRSTASR